jgi:hypothetical protein
MNSRKSQAKYLMWVVFFAALIIVVIGLVWNFKITAEAKTAEAICKADIETYSSEWFKEEEPKIRCPTEDITITVTDNRRILEQVAGFMYKCAKRYDGGIKQVFSEEKITYCDICYTIEFNTKKPITGLKDYLETHKNPEGETHMDYLFGWETEAPPDLSRKMFDVTVPKDPLDPTKTYAVIFINPKGPTNIEKFFNFTAYKLYMITSIITLEIVHYFRLSHTEWAAFTILSEYETQTLKEICDYLPVAQSLEET